MDDPNPARLADLAARVAAQHREQSDAIADERQAAAGVLAQIVDAVRPALKALSSRLLKEERTWWPDNAAPTTDKTYHAERGVILAGDGPERDHPRANQGAIVGEALALLEDGTFARLDWSGNWSNWQGATSTEQSALTTMSALDVVGDYDLDAIAEALADRLDAQLAGRATKTTATARARA